LSASTGLTEAGSDLGEMTWNWNAGLTLTWPLFQGGLTNGQSAEASANLVGLRADLDQLGQQVRFEIEQARLAVRAAKAALVASEEAVTAARERLRLAEGRYQTGVGNGLELEDAQLALTSARGQQVQAEYSLASARAGLLGALGE
jgi:outer membrane protein